jgi:hypothetical protein
MALLAVRCLQEKAQAQSFANALGTIGKFVIKKKTGDKDQIYGSVQVGIPQCKQGQQVGLLWVMQQHEPEMQQGRHLSLPSQVYAHAAVCATVLDL